MILITELASKPRWGTGRFRLTEQARQYLRLQLGDYIFTVFEASPFQIVREEWALRYCQVWACHRNYRIGRAGATLFLA